LEHDITVVVGLFFCNLKKTKKTPSLNMTWLWHYFLLDLLYRRSKLGCIIFLLLKLL